MGAVPQEERPVALIRAYHIVCGIADLLEIGHQDTRRTLTICHVARILLKDLVHVGIQPDTDKPALAPLSLQTIVEPSHDSPLSF